jgi:hypothetical protein
VVAAPSAHPAADLLVFQAALPHSQVAALFALQVVADLFPPVTVY